MDKQLNRLLMSISCLYTFTSSLILVHYYLTQISGKLLSLKPTQSIYVFFYLSYYLSITRQPPSLHASVTATRPSLFPFIFPSPLKKKSEKPRRN